MVLCVSVKKPPDHSLILGIVLLCLTFKKVYAALAQGKRYLDSLIPKDQVLWAWKKVGDNLKLSERLVGVSYFLAHKFAFLSASNLLRKFGVHRRDT